MGLGKIGIPYAYALASRGLNVYGHDPAVTGPPRDCSHETGLAELIAQAEDRVRFCSLSEVVANCDVILVAVQTPHEPRFEGVTPLPVDRADFDYAHLVRAVGELDRAAMLQDRDVTMAVVSTVLPGTMAREIVPFLSQWVQLVYCPAFIAMGTTVRDFLDPEFVLLGGDTDGRVGDMYRMVFGDQPVRFINTTVENAELIKVAYNTFIGLKIAFANTLMEVCHKTGCDVDQVTGALKQADRRLTSPAYMDGGMGDGGGCHPRDNIALSWLAGELDLSYDLFHAAMEAREKHAEWLCDLMEQHDLPMGILGVAYKPGSRITTGSPALLVRHLLQRRGHHVRWHDPHVSTAGRLPEEPHVFLVGCKHPEFPAVRFPEGSVVIDPFRFIPDQPGVEVVRVGQTLPAGKRLFSTNDARKPYPPRDDPDPMILRIT